MLTFYILTIAHFVADFMLQGDKVAVNKKGANKFMLAHAGIISAAFFLPLINYPAGKVFLATAIVFVAHVLVDAGKVEAYKFLKLDPFNGGYWKLLGIDQILHISVIYAAFSFIVL